MAYVTGSATSFANLLASIQTALTDNGWTLSGSVLHKDSTYIAIAVVGTTLTFKGGTGIDGSNNLTGAGPDVARITSGIAGITLAFPATYDVHINTSPDEVYVVVNYNVTEYQWAAWGISDSTDIPGTGVWYAASCVNAAPAIRWIGGPTPQTTGTGVLMMGLFYSPQAGKVVGSANSYIHDGLDSGAWSPAGATGICAWSWSAVVPMLGLLPNTWNGETTLLPMPIYKPRSTGNKVSLVADLKHVRLCRIDNYAEGEIITLGTDKWKVYPWYKKNTAARDASVGVGAADSGTLGYAVRYTGP